MNSSQKLQTAAFIAVLSLANAAGVQETYGGTSPGPVTSAKITITARVLEHTSLAVLRQVRELVVTSADTMRGSVNIPAATRVQVRSNNPAGYLLLFEMTEGPSPLFTSVQVFVGGREVRLSPGGGWFPQPFVRGGVTLDLSYRFTLSKDAQPGTYDWPLLISALPR